MMGLVELSVTITNTGKRAGCEVVQLYVHDKLASQVRPVKELKGFCRVELTEGEAKRVFFTLPVDMLNFTNDRQQRVVEPGVFEVMVGKSSSDIQLTTEISVTGETRILPNHWNMLCHTEVAEV